MLRTRPVISGCKDGWKLKSSRKRIDMASLYQEDQFKNLSKEIRVAVERTQDIEQRLTEQSQGLEDSNAKILEAVTNSAVSNGEEHQRTRDAVLETASTIQAASAVNHEETIRQVTSLGLQLTGTVKVASEANDRHHETTLTEIELIRSATEQQVKELREEIRQLKLEIERSVQKIVSSIGKVSESEQQRLKESSNAKFNVWVAKEIVLKNLLVRRCPNFRVTVLPS